MSNPTEPLDLGNFAETPDVLKHTESEKHPMRVGTIVWGAVVLALGTLIILTRQAGLHLDAGQTAIWLLFGAGVAMVAGGAINLLRRKTQ
jgi:predicted phage tail protein